RIRSSVAEGRATTSPFTSYDAGRTIVPHSPAANTVSRAVKTRPRTQRDRASVLSRRYGDLGRVHLVRGRATHVGTEIVSGHDPRASASFLHGAGGPLVATTQSDREEGDAEDAADSAEHHVEGSLRRRDDGRAEIVPVGTAIPRFVDRWERIAGDVGLGRLLGNDWRQGPSREQCHRYH